VTLMFLFTFVLYNISCTVSVVVIELRLQWHGDDVSVQCYSNIHM
jgi:hypothetical protein